MKHAVFIAIAALVCVCALARARDTKSARPRITGIDYVRLYTSSLDASTEFYSKFVGLPSSGGGCSKLSIPCFPVNDHQQVELVLAPLATPKNWVAEIGFATDNILQMRAYLTANRIPASRIARDANGAQHFELHDPEGTRIAFVQRPATVAAYEMSAAPIGDRLLHAGFVVKDMAAENKFWLDVLGFKLYWYGGFKDDGVDWYEIQVPDGSDWIEYMLNIPANADHKELGIQNHFSLGVRDIHAAADRLHKNGLAKLDGPEIGRDGKWGLDAYDPDGTRVEFMEFTPAGTPCCHPYTAPHPRP